MQHCKAASRCAGSMTKRTAAAKSGNASFTRDRPPSRSNRRVEMATDNDVDNDVADWGHTQVDSQADDSDGAPHSLSSGLSARDQEWGQGRGGPRPRKFDVENGVSSLVHHTKQYVSAQRLRKCASCLNCSMPVLHTDSALSAYTCTLS